MAGLDSDSQGHRGTNSNGREKEMKKVLLIALVATGLLMVPARSDAQVSVGIGGVGIGWGYPGYRYGGYYPYGSYYGGYPYSGYSGDYFYRTFPCYRYFSGSSHTWYDGRLEYRHHP